MKPFTKRDKRLLKVCEVVRKHFGLGDLCFEYTFEKGDGDAYAYQTVFFSGWKVHICFLDEFFTRTQRQQLETIVHEHIHAMMHPHDQADNRAERLVPESLRPEYALMLDTSREITVTHATQSLLNLLMPHIRKVL